MTEKRFSWPPRTEVGQRFGFYVITDPGPIYKSGKRYVGVLCDCGRKKQARESDLLNGDSAGCYSCAQKVNKSYLKLDDTTLVWNYFLNGYVQNAKKRGIEFNLTMEEFKIIVEANCHYCGREPHMVKKGTITANGVDRVDNTRGYEVDNCVAACKWCNYWKKDMTVEDFYAQARRITEFGLKR